MPPLLPRGLPNCSPAVSRAQPCDPLQGVLAGTWSTLPSMPAALGEVAAGLLTDKSGNQKLVVLGEGAPVRGEEGRGRAGRRCGEPGGLRARRATSAAVEAGGSSVPRLPHRPPRCPPRRQRRGAGPPEGLLADRASPRARARSTCSPPLAPPGPHLPAGNDGTFIYDLGSRKWGAGAKRPFVGHHIGAEVIDGKLYLFGGLRAGSNKAGGGVPQGGVSGGRPLPACRTACTRVRMPGSAPARQPLTRPPPPGGPPQVQIYNVDTNKWTTGADLPYDVGSAATARIGGHVYLCGGITLSNSAFQRGASEGALLGSRSKQRSSRSRGCHAWLSMAVPVAGSSVCWRAPQLMPPAAPLRSCHSPAGATTSKCIKYNIKADKWEQGVAPMPKGVNHAASSSDGARMYVAGGRDGPNRVSAGFNSMQVGWPRAGRELGARGWGAQCC